ncbi:hypothetical protein P691DRAFT_783456 [Macrolepiota fuliginosa MF-IS2]|uniref:Uncharacterized protein n=1 Tax=Macrolepiota fuliginosa MF-IS2 TaxID=1400762 RepID=A0A9P5XC85_9AGAR|nr:hypothetical protein P691DRAFT_783456 [Macrolepiota fuliginosa MF-IS2]
MPFNLKRIANRCLKLKTKVREWSQLAVPKPQMPCQALVDIAPHPTGPPEWGAKADSFVKPSGAISKVRARLGRIKKSKTPPIEIVDPLRDEYHKFIVSTRGVKGLPIDVFVNIETKVTLEDSSFISDETTTTATSSSGSFFHASTPPTTVADAVSEGRANIHPPVPLLIALSAKSIISSAYKDQYLSYSLMGNRIAADLGFFSRPTGVPFESVIRTPWSLLPPESEASLELDGELASTELPWNTTADTDDADQNDSSSLSSSSVYYSAISDSGSLLSDASDSSVLLAFLSANWVHPQKVDCVY